MFDFIEPTMVTKKRKRMKTIKVYYNSKSLQHALYPFFAEKPQRVTELITLFKNLNIPMVISEKATYDLLLSAHKKEYIDFVKKVSQVGKLEAFYLNTFGNYLQWYTRVSQGSYAAASYSVGGVVQAVENVLTEEISKAFCIARPPGHHAGISRGEGFCIFNNVAIGALSAIEKGASRVAIIDFDRHHGNGTEEIVRHYANGKILFISSFQEGCKYYDDSLEEDDKIITIAIPEHSSFAEVEKLYQENAIQSLYDFNPDLILISAGFDMYIDDPLTNIKLETKDFYSLTKMIVDVANDVCEGKIVSVLEGGYDINALQLCVKNHIEAFT